MNGVHEMRSVISQWWNALRGERPNSDRSRTERREHSSQRRALRLEPLETRIALAVDLMAIQVDALATRATVGQPVAISTTVKNGGTTASGSFTVEYRLSLDSTITATDLLLGSTTWTSLAGGVQTTSTANLTVPSSIPHGDYRVGVIVKPNIIYPDTNSTNNTAADSTATEVLSTSLTGSVSYAGIAKTVSIRSAAGATTPIYDDVPTWIVIHGRNSSPTSSNLVALAQSIDGYRTGDQVLVLDWSNAAASGLLGGSGENYIKPVATWAASVLTTYGLDGGEINLAGHSWGAYVAAELAERVPGAAVDSIIALDPAADYPGGSYNPTATGEVDFARNSNYSWSFYANGGSFGTATTARTADEAIVVNGSDHSKLVNVFASLVSYSYAASTASAAQVGSAFQLDRLLNATPSSLWVANQYDSAGRRSSVGPFEAVVTASSDGLRAAALKYFTGTTEVSWIV